MAEIPRYEAHTPYCDHKYCRGCGELVRDDDGAAVMFEDHAAEMAKKDKQLRDEALAFNHANEVVAKLEADLAAAQQQIATLEKEIERLTNLCDIVIYRSVC